MKLRDQGKTYVPPRKGGAKTARAEGGAPAAAGGGGDKAGGGGKAGGAGGSGGGAASGGGKDAAAGGDRKARHYLGDKTPGWRPFDAVEVGRVGSWELGAGELGVRSCSLGPGA